ncbi:hypothetical protein [Thermococcus sp. GR6]|uniref:hypothetical protein n=1 Tax=Thermococcus sp. GR6 TaxID=1638256 RepID=UPI0014304676|nr:hypothetical protein [Thermococcus sp. GR6]NJE41855.1 hypothetical protein [Thermococcus sp. GR6]
MSMRQVSKKLDKIDMKNCLDVKSDIVLSVLVKKQNRKTLTEEFAYCGNETYELSNKMKKAIQKTFGRNRVKFTEVSHDHWGLHSEARWGYTDIVRC